MNKKTQIFAIREVFQFGIGLIIMLGVAVLFSQNIEPQIRSYALNKHIENINSHIYYLISEVVEESSDNVLYSNFSALFEMPSDINKYSYRIYFQDNNICTSYTDVPVSDCINTSFNNIDFSGQFLSGGRLRISCFKDSESMSVVLSTN